MEFILTLAFIGFLIYKGVEYVKAENKKAEIEAQKEVQVANAHLRTYKVPVETAWTQTRDYLSERSPWNLVRWRVLTTDTQQMRVVAVASELMQMPVPEDMRNLIMQQTGGRQAAGQLILEIQMEIKFIAVDGGCQMAFSWEPRRQNKDWGHFVTDYEFNTFFEAVVNGVYSCLDQLLGQAALPIYVKKKGELTGFEHAYVIAEVGGSSSTPEAKPIDQDEAIRRKRLDT
jgi:hypothetical protein